MQDLFLILPLLIIVAGSLCALLLGVFAGSRLAFQSAVVSLVVALISAVRLLPLAERGKSIFHGMLYYDPMALFSVILIIFGTMTVLVFAYRQIDQSASSSKEGVDFKAEFYTLMLLSAFGACVLSMAAHVAVFFVSLEIMSLALYCLCGSAIWREDSSESAVKYFVLGAFSSALLLYGFALLFSLTGELGFNAISAKLLSLNSELLLVAMALVSAGILMKLSAFPFHFWTADVYQGAPSSVTAFMASVIKVASFCAAIRIFWIAFGPAVAFWSEFLPVIAVSTMCVGTLMAIRQRDIKRILAFSSIAHSGYLMVGLLAGASESQGIAALLFYLTLYMIMTIGAFDIIGALFAEKGDSSLSALKGFAKSRPLAGLFLSFFMLCLAGLPPGVAGLIAKIQLFTSAVRADYAWVVIIALINSAVGCYYYLRIIRAIYSHDSAESSRAQEAGESALSGGSFGIAALCALILLYFSFMPGLLMTVCVRVSELV